MCTSAHHPCAHRRTHQGHHRNPALVCHGQPIIRRGIPVPQTLCIYGLESPLPISAGLFPAGQAAEPWGICRQHKVLISSLAEVKTSRQQIIFPVSPITLNLPLSSLFGGHWLQSVHLFIWEEHLFGFVGWGFFVCFFWSLFIPLSFRQAIIFF